MKLNCETYAPKVAAHRVFIHVDRDADGKIVGVACSTAHVGSTLRTHHDALARLATLALQHGATVAAVADVLANVECDPSGTVWDHESISEAKSIADLMGQVLRAAA